MGEKKSKKSKKDKKHHHKKHKKHSRHHSDSSQSDNEQEIDYSDPSLWVESTDQQSTAAPPIATATQEPQQQQAPRHEWMLNESFDFGSLGSAKPKEEEIKPNPDEVIKKNNNNILKCIKKINKLILLNSFFMHKNIYFFSQRLANVN